MIGQGASRGIALTFADLGSTPRRRCVAGEVQMLKVLKWAIRSKARDDEADSKRFDRLAGVMEEVLSETSREYEGLVKRMRELSSRGVNETVYAIKPLTKEQLAASQEDVSKQLEHAVARTERLVEQVKIQRALVATLRKAREDGIL